MLFYEWMSRLQHVHHRRWYQRLVFLPGRHILSRVVVGPSGNGVGRYNEAILCQVQLLLRWLTVCRYACWYVTSQSGKLGLLPSAGWEMSTFQEAVTVYFGLKVRHEVTQGCEVCPPTGLLASESEMSSVPVCTLHFYVAYFYSMMLS